MFFVKSSVTTHTCPVCNEELRYRDSRIRIRKREGGVVDKLRIRRFYCSKCDAYHNELPDCLVPYKHYDAEVISGVLDGIVCEKDLDSEDFPSVSTMRRWIQWFNENRERMEGYLREVTLKVLDKGEEILYSSVSLLESIRKSRTNWLEQILRTIYNSGGFFVPIRW